MDHAPRAAVPRFLRAVSRRVVQATLLASALVLGSSAVATASPAAAPATVGAQPSAASISRAPDDQVSVFIAPRDGGLVQPGAPVSLELVVVNMTETEVPAGELELTMGRATIDTRFALEAWNTAENPNAANQLEDITTVPTEAVAADGSTTVNLSLPAEDLPFSASSDFGPRPVAATLTVDDAQIAQARSSLVLNAPANVQPTKVSAVVPITSGLSSTPLMSADDLAAQTSPGGRLASVLDAVEGTQATLAIDPRILVSIRVLGTTAPAPAVEWLTRLEAVTNETFELPFADASPTLQSQWGADQPFQVQDFSFALDPANFAAAPEPQATTPEPEPEPSEDAQTASPQPTEAPEATASEAPDAPAAPVLPTTAELTSFPYTQTGVVWPQAGTVQAADLERFVGWGGKSIILDTTNVEPSDAFSYTPNAAAMVNGWTSVVSEATLSDALDDAVHAQSDEEWNEAATRVATLLAVVTRELPNEARSLVGTITRDDFSGERLGQTLRFIEGLAWADGEALSFAPSAEEVEAGDGQREEVLRDGSVGGPALEQMTVAVEIAGRGREISTIFAQPEPYADEIKAAVIGTLSTGWAVHPEGLGPAIEQARAYVTVTESSVQLGDTSEALIVGRETELPVFVSNSLTTPVNVLVELRPSTGGVETGDAVALTIEPGSMARAGLPVTAIANGATYVTVNVKTPEGVSLSTTQQIRLEVRAEWESVAVLVLSVGLGLLFVAGIVRTVRRRRADRAAAADSLLASATSEE